MSNANKSRPVSKKVEGFEFYKKLGQQKKSALNITFKDKESYYNKTALLQFEKMRYL